MICKISLQSQSSCYLLYIQTFTHFQIVSIYVLSTHIFIYLFVHQPLSLSLSLCSNYRYISSPSHHFFFSFLVIIQFALFLIHNKHHHETCLLFHVIISSRNKSYYYTYISLCFIFQKKKKKLNLIYFIFRPPMNENHSSLHLFFFLYVYP